ncbi:MAG: cytochrome c oxidase subunit II [Bacteroidetes bacterium]|nr:cytochrome c oxidase subunit II [Bacteroidota bacterium]MDA1120359.1 cytochrome c oxidase subunit II [Bacteroidota bacterium]
MSGFVIGLGLLLLGAILIAIFRVTTLIGIAKGDGKKRVGSANGVNAFLFIVFLVGSFILLFWYSYTHFDSYNLPLASEHGVVTDRIFWITMGVTCVAFIITHVLLFVFPYVYRFKEEKEAFYFPHNNKLELTWTIVPAVVLSVLIFTGWRAWVDITAPAPEDSERIEIMGYQFAWAVRYGGGDGQLGKSDFRLIDVDNRMGIDFSDRKSYDDFIPLEIHIPKGKNIEFKIRATDVIHSVFAPHFRLQMNAVPGLPTSFWFTPTKTTAEMRSELENENFNYELVCNKICGKGHFAMRYLIIVDEPEAYQEWYKSQQAWLKLNPDYLSKVPADLREVAAISAKMDGSLN